MGWLQEMEQNKLSDFPRYIEIVKIFFRTLIFQLFLV